MTFSDRAIASSNAQDTDEVWLMLFTLDHADLADPIRVVSNNEDIVSNGHTFIALGFELTLPGQDPDSPSSATVSLDNVDPVIVNTLRTISSPPTATIQVILASQPDVIEIEFTGLKLRNAQWDASKVSGDLVYEDVLTEPVATTMTPQRFPGLF